MRNNFQAIIFDLDGTLLDSEVVWHEAEEQLVSARGFEYTLDARAHLLGLRLDEGLARLRDYFGFQDDVPTLIDEINQNMIQLIKHGVTPMPGAPEIVAWVVEQNIPRAIASASPQLIIDALVDSQGWLPHFQIRCTCDDVARGKPAPDVYLAAAQALGVDPTRCLALEDTPNGSRAAVAAGMTCYAIPDRKYSNDDAFRDITPHVFYSMHDVLNLLRAQG